MQLIFINISTSELVIVLLVVMVLFGPKKLPDIVRFLGKLFNDIKHASEEVKREITQSTQGITEDLKKAGEQIRQEIDNSSKTVMDAVPRASIRTFEKSKPEEKAQTESQNNTKQEDSPSEGNNA